MIGEQKFDVVEPGRKYRLSDGTGIAFLSRDAMGEVAGVTSEELIQVLIHRMAIQRDTFKAREASLAITALEEAEHWLWRWDVNRTRARTAKGT